MFRRLRLFVSYRRSDAQASAGRLFALLQAQFGPEQVFLDTASIPFGEDFRAVVRKRIAASDVVLAVIGPQWLAASDEHGRRLDREDDPVRFELASALAGRKRVVPVLVGGAQPPPEVDLPDVLRPLAPLNMAPLREASFDADFDALVDELHGRRRGTLRTELERVRRLLVGATGGAVLAPIAALVLAGGAWIGVLDVLNLDTHALRLLLQTGGHDGGERVLLVTIDADSERRLNRPFDPARAAEWRLDHARLIERAARAGAAAIAFDLFFESGTAADTELAAAAAQAASRTPPTRVIFGVRTTAAGVPALVPPLRKAAAWGALCLVPRGGGAVWSSPLAVLRPLGAGERVPADTPSLALAATVAAPLRAADVPRRELDFDGVPLDPPVRFSAVQRQSLESPQCRTGAVGELFAAMLLRPAPAGHWRTAQRSVSYADALASAAVPDAMFSGRIVVVGVTALQRDGANRDVHTVRDGFAPRTVYGVELQADAVATLAGGRVPRLPTADRQALTALAASLVGAVASLLLYPRTRWLRRAGLAGLTLAWLGLAVWLAAHDVLTNPGYDMAALWIAYGVLRALQTLARRDLRRVVT